MEIFKSKEGENKNSLVMSFEKNYTDGQKKASSSCAIALEGLSYEQAERVLLDSLYFLKSLAVCKSS